MTLQVVKLNNMKSFLLIKVNMYMYIHVVSGCLILGKYNCYTQAFRQMSVQPSCGCPLKENRFIFHMINCLVEQNLSTFWASTFQILAKSLVILIDLIRLIFYPLMI